MNIYFVSNKLVFLYFYCNSLIGLTSICNTITYKIMKKLILTFILGTIVTVSFGQNKQSYFQLVDSLSLINTKTQTYMDTTWVMDSSLLYGYPGGGNEIILERTYEVIKRNEFGNVLVSINKVPEYMEPSFLNSEHDSITYFDGINIKQHYSSVWNSIMQTWVENKYLEYETPELLKEEFDKKFSNEMQQYNFGYRKLYDNSSGRMDTMFRYSYYDETNPWIVFRKTTYHYNESDSCTYEITEQFDELSNSWINDFMYNYSYNNDGNLYTKELKFWDQENNIWNDINISYFTYDESGRLINHLQMQYNVGLQEMVNSKNLVVEYNNNNITKISQNWFAPEGSWWNQYRDFFSYYTENKLDTIQQDYWDHMSNQWNKLYLTASHYDNHENIYEESFYSSSGGAWELEFQTDFFWSPMISNDIPEIKGSPIAVFPNPASTTVTFHTNSLPQNSNLKVSIYNITGQKVAAITMIENELRWDCSNLEAGLYIYSVDNEENRYTGKIIVR